MSHAGMPTDVAAGRDLLDQLRLRVAAGADPGDLDRLRPTTAAAVRLATAVGAPLLAVRDAAAAVEDDERRAERAVTVASAQGRTVAATLLLAPVVLVPVMARLFGIDLVAYHRTPVGAVTGAVAAVLMAAGGLAIRAVVHRVWRPPRARDPRRVRAAGLLGALLVGVLTHLLVTAVLVVVVWRATRPRSPPTDPLVAHAAELVAVAVSAGCAASTSLRLAADEAPPLAVVLRRVAFDLDVGNDPAAGGAVGVPAGVDRLAMALVTAGQLGAPLTPTLRRLAADLRGEELARVLAATERLPVRLTVPTALLLLPGVLLAVGAPIVVSALTRLGS